MTTVDIPNGRYRPCPVCTAPIRNPFPPTWTAELTMTTGEPGITYITPHRADCVAPPTWPHVGTTMRLPGRHIAAMRFLPPPPDPVPTPFDSGWREIGYTDGGGTVMIKAAEQRDPNGEVTE